MLAPVLVSSEQRMLPRHAGNTLGAAGLSLIPELQSRDLYVLPLSFQKLMDIEQLVAMCRAVGTDLLMRALVLITNAKSIKHCPTILISYQLRLYASLLVLYTNILDSSFFGVSCVRHGLVVA